MSVATESDFQSNQRSPCTERPEGTRTPSGNNLSEYIGNSFGAVIHKNMWITAFLSNRLNEIAINIIY